MLNRERLLVTKFDCQRGEELTLRGGRLHIEKRGGGGLNRAFTLL